MSRNATTATVDLDAEDPKKRVSRAGGSADVEAPDEVEQRNSKWLDRSRSVQKRVARTERNLKRQFDQRFAEQQAEHQREMREMREQMDKLSAQRQTDATAASQAQHDAEMKALEEAQAAAYEAGDSTKAASIGRQMARKEAEWFNKLTQQQLQATRTEKREDTTQQRQSGKRNQKAAEFVEANADWWDDEENEDAMAARGYANELFRRASDAGRDLESDKLFAEIGKKLRKRFPDLELKGLDSDEDDDADGDEDDDEQEEQPRKRAPVRSFRSQNGGGGRRGSTHLTEEDFEAMRAVNMDPDNDQHCVQWVETKRELESQEQ